MTDIETSSSYRNILPIESLVAGQINRCMEFLSKKLTEFFIESVEGLILLLPPEIEDSILTFKKENEIFYSNTVEGKEKYMLLFREIKKQLTNQNIVWHRSSYATGHD
jgi:hypothetical protein